jgi:hypothetical protein
MAMLNIFYLYINSKKLQKSCKHVRLLFKICRQLEHGEEHGHRYVPKRTCQFIDEGLGQTWVGGYLTGLPPWATKQACKAWLYMVGPGPPEVGGIRPLPPFLLPGLPLPNPR